MLLAPLLVPHKLETTSDQRNSVDISKGEALANEESVDKEVRFEDLGSAVASLLVVFDALLVVGVLSNQGAEPASDVREDFAVDEGHPSDDLGVVLLCLSKECGLLVLRGDYNMSVVLQARQIAK